MLNHSQKLYEVTDEYARFINDTATSGKNINLIWGLILRSRILLSIHILSHHAPC